MQFQYMNAQITWQPMTPKQSRWHAAYSSAVAGAIRGLAFVVDAAPQLRRAA